MPKQLMKKSKNELGLAANEVLITIALLVIIIAGVLFIAR